MRFPIYWKRARNEAGTVSARGWSDSSSEEAQQNARQRLGRVLSALKSDGIVQLSRDYQYVIDHLICEFVVDRIYDDQGAEVAVVSRNAYGSLILNTPRLMMVDIDLPPGKFGGWLSRLFGKPQPNPEELQLQKLTAWQKSNPAFSFRVYRTSAGLRLLVSNRTIDRIDQQIFQIMEELNADPLYLELCRKQKCFRARLMPKPWRIHMPRPPKTFPFDDLEDEQEFDDWFNRYLSASKEYKVCRYLMTIGSTQPDPAAKQLIDLHDKFCCREQELTLA